MQKSKIRVTILTIAAVLTTAVILAIACAPAEPTPQSNGEETAQPHQNTENESASQQKAPYRVDTTTTNWTGRKASGQHQPPA